MTAPTEDDRLVSDVAVIGGGPAGSAAAITLASRGVRTVVVERERFPRFHVGESLLPYQVDLFERLGVRNAIEAAGFQDKLGAHFSSSDGRVIEALDFGELGARYRQAFEVERADFDELLLRRAARCGAQVLEEHTVVGADLGEDGCRLEILDRSRAARSLRCRWVVDASGQSSFLARSTGVRRVEPDLKKVALFTHFRGGWRFDPPHQGDILLVLGDRCWFWHIPLRGETLSVGCVVDQGRMRESREEPEEFFRRQVRENPCMSERLRGTKQIRELQVAADFSYGAERYAGPGFLLAGDAAAFLDPIFSTGVALAMRSGELAGELLARRILRERPLHTRAFRGYERRLRRWTRAYFRLIRAFYHPGFGAVFFNPRPRYKRMLTPFFAGNFEPRVRERLCLRIFYLVIRLNHRWHFLEDPRDAEARAHHG